MVAHMDAGPFNLTSVTESSLVFDLWLKSEMNFDLLLVTASTDGDWFTILGDVSGDSQGWTTLGADLADYVGEPSVWIGFLFLSDFSIVDEGAYIDEVRVTRTGITSASASGLSPVGPADATGLQFGGGDAGKVFGRAQAIDALLGDPDTPLAARWSLQ